MNWLDAAYLMPDGTEVDVRINLDQVRAFKRRNDNRVLVLWAIPNIGAIALTSDYDAFMLVLDGDDTA